MNKKFADMEKQLESKKLPNIDWLQEGCYHTSIAALISKMGTVWSKYSAEEKAHLSRIYSYPGGYFKLSNDEENNLLVDLKRKAQLADELSVFKLINPDDYEEMLKSKDVELTDLERRFMADYVNELKQQNTAQDAAMKRRS